MGYCNLSLRSVLFIFVLLFQDIAVLQLNITRDNFVDDIKFILTVQAFLHVADRFELQPQAGRLSRSASWRTTLLFFEEKGIMLKTILKIIITSQ